jgi:hypothetical protein
MISIQGSLSPSPGDTEKAGVTQKMYGSEILQSNIKFLANRSNFEILLFPGI